MKVWFKVRVMVRLRLVLGLVLVLGLGLGFGPMWSSSNLNYASSPLGG